MAQNLLAHGPGAITSCSPTAMRPLSVSTAVTLSSEPSSKSVTSVWEWIGDAFREALVAEAGDRLEVERETTLVLVEAHRDALPRQSGKSSFMCASTSASPR